MIIAVFVYGLRSDLDEKIAKKIKIGLSEIMINVRGSDASISKCYIIPDTQRILAGEEEVLIETSNFPPWLFHREPEISSGLRKLFTEILPDIISVNCIIR